MPNSEPIRHWTTADAACRSSGGRLITEAEWEVLAREASAEPSLERPGAVFGESFRFRPAVREFVQDCFVDQPVPMSTVDPVVERPGCFEHVGRVLRLRSGTPNILSREKNPLDGRFRCVAGSGLDREGRVYRWLISGPHPFDGTRHALPSTTGILATPPVLGDTAGVLDGDPAHGLWFANEPRLEDGRSLSPCSDSQRTCSGNSLSIDFSCELFGDDDDHALNGALAVSYLHVAAPTRVRIVAA